MTIRNRIVLTFSALSSIVMVFSFFLIYYLSEHFMDADFYDLLSEKATLTAWKYFEKDEMSEALYDKMIEKNVRTLPDATEMILDTKNKPRVVDSLLKILPTGLVRELISGRNVRYRSQDKQMVGLYYPDNQGTFIIVITAVNKFGIREQKKLLQVMLIIFFGSILLTFLLGKFYATNVLSPIANILRNVKKIRATNLSLRLKENERNDELSELTRTFNQMLERLEHSFTLQKNFIHNSSHELKNPLTAIMGETEIALSRERTPAEYVETLRKISSEAGRLDLLTRNLLSLAQTESDQPCVKMEAIRMDEFLWEIKEHFDKTAYRERIDVHFPVLPENPDRITITGIPFLLEMAVVNLVDNACKFSDPHRVDVTLELVPGRVHLKIADHGIGIPEAEMESLFQPFFRASNAIRYRGSGIGLSLVHRITAMHHGTIRITSVIGKGTVADIDLPVMKPS